jgi:hypothetical protein
MILSVESYVFATAIPKAAAKVWPAPAPASSLAGGLRQKPGAGAFYDHSGRAKVTWQKRGPRTGLTEGVYSFINIYSK